jgi:hypothetical protein
MNSKTRALACMLSIIGLLLFTAVGVFAQEHPEHPAKKDAAAKKEHPEHPAKQDVAKKEHPEHPKAAMAAVVTKEMMAEAITGYINKDTDLKGGFFCCYDTKANAPLALKLDKVHQDKLAKVSEGLYFACSDFKATDGKMYDLDFFMKSTEHGLQVSEVAIHKEAGKPRYGWVEKNGVWSKQVMQ